MANSLDLDPEWGAIDLLEEVEDAFGIKIADEEATRCETVGDLYEVLCLHTPDWEAQDGSCASLMVFYRIRRSLAPENKSDVTPQTPLLKDDVSPARLFKMLNAETGLRLPSTEVTRLGATGGLMLTGGVIAGIVALGAGAWLASVVSLLIAFLGLPMLWLDRGRLPAGIETVGDLVRRTAPLNPGMLKAAGGHPPDRWSVLVSLAAEYGVLTPDQIGPDTFFHRKSLKMVTSD